MTNKSNQLSQGNLAQQVIARMGHACPKMEKILKPFLSILKKTPGFKPRVSGMVNDFKYQLNLNDYIQQQMYYFGCFDRKGVNLIVDLCKQIRCRTALDIGANVGNHAVHLSTACEKIYCFEPNETVANVLEEAINDSQSNIVLSKEGLSNKNETLTFYENSNNLGGSSFIQEHVSGKCEPTTKTLTVSHAGEAMNRLNIHDIDFIKIDVEGLEHEILNALSEIIKRDQPVINLEFNRITAGKFGTLLELKNAFPGYAFYGAEKPSFDLLSTRLILKPFQFSKNYAHLIAVPERFSQCIKLPA